MASRIKIALSVEAQISAIFEPNMTAAAMASLTAFTSVTGSAPGCATYSRK
ncbi:MAG: hypothetical protein U5N86_06575 [Planctomycetota bacterium]|nr:hypothetical protein [Planctomycetota bacterium]